MHIVLRKADFVSVLLQRIFWLHVVHMHGACKCVRSENFDSTFSNFFTFFFLSLGASACIKLNQFEEAITWCDKGLSVSFVMLYLCLT